MTHLTPAPDGSHPGSHPGLGAAPVPRPAPPTAPVAHIRHPGVSTPARPPAPRISAAERAFFVAEFRDVTIVVSLPHIPADAVDPLRRTLQEFAPGGTRFVLVVPDHHSADQLRPLVPGLAVLTAPPAWDARALADLWVRVTDHRVVALVARAQAPGRDQAPAPDPADAVAQTAGAVAAGLRAAKVVLTDPAGGWGDPPRSFADLAVHRTALQEELNARGSAALLGAAELALRGGAFSVNLCRPGEIELELFTFDGAGTVLTLGGYIQVGTLRVDDLPAVERLVALGVREGVLKPRSRSEVARMAVSGLGARVARTGHLAGIVGLETTAYAAERLGEISGLITVSEFSGAGAGGLLVDGLLERAASQQLRALFAVTVSDEAAAFFLRRGFREVGQGEIPAAKWHGYDPERLARARCFWREV